jgi:two-component system response regulator AtoC
MSALEAYRWPGNVRELKNVLTKAVLESRGSVLLANAVKTALISSAEDSPDTMELRTLDEIEREHILKCFTETGGNLSAAARALGLSRPTLRKRLKLYGLSR